MRVAARMTGVSPERMRAWESRHAAIRPLRTTGGTRRYTLSDVDRLRLLRRVVESGHRIGDVAHFDLSELRACLPATETDPSNPFAEILTAIDRLDPGETRRLLAAKQDEVGDIVFARDLAIPLSAEIGRRWAAGELTIAAEHFATGIIRSLLVGSLERVGPDGTGPRVVFATPSGERHDLGLLVAALVTRKAGATAVFLGADVPEEDILDSVRSTRADALAIGFAIPSPDRVEATLVGIRRALPESVAVWVGGAGIGGCAPVDGVDRVENLDRLEAMVLTLCGTSHVGLGVAGSSAS